MKYLIYIIFVLCAALFISVRSCTSIAADRDRQEANVSSLLNDVETYKLNDSLNGLRVDALTLEKTELKEHYEDAVGVCRDLNIKIKRLEAISNTKTETKLDFEAPTTDTIIIGGSLPPIAAKHFSWSDPWSSVQGVITEDHISCKLRITDSIAQIVHRVPKQWWIFKWGTAAIRQEVISFNPNTEIKYSEYIRVE